MPELDDIAIVSLSLWVGQFLFFVLLYQKFKDKKN